MKYHLKNFTALKPRLKWLSPIVFVVCFFIALTSAHAAVDPAKGKSLFQNNCSACHLLSDKKLVGPGLKDVDQRHSEAWMLKWIKNNAALRSSGDKEANDLFAANGGAAMTLFTSMEDDDIKSILAYVKTGGDAATSTTTTGGTPAPESSTDYTLLMIVIITMLVLLSILLRRVRQNLMRMSKEKLGEDLPKQWTIMQRLKSRRTWATVIMFLVIIGGYEMVIGAQKLGRSKGYQPVQPIHFSHRIHAGLNKIDCKYCHAGVEKSKTASIPSISICMNCHKGVSEGETPAGTEEIQKIYYYAGFDPSSMTYSKEPHEIKWTRIHNLPDHVYFNHSQHVVAGKLACQKCHGPIETEDEVYQFASLGMGWCVNCHRETRVQFSSNHYYDGLYEDVHERLKMHPQDSVTVEQLGGTECQKCHY